MLIVKLFDTPAICRIIEQEKVSHYSRRADDAGRTARRTRTGAIRRFVGENVLLRRAVVAPDLVRNIQRVFGCAFGTLYGQTETSPVITQHFVDDSLDDICNTIGQPLPHTEVSIRNVDNNVVAPIDNVGEICVRGYCNMIEYHGNPDATRQTIDADGWLHTGDLGAMDARGYIRITGRVKDMIIRGGENMFPAEIENALLEHPQIAEVAVVGIPDDKWGEVIGCFFRTENDVLVAARTLHAFCRERLSPQKTPTIWCQVDEFPMTGSRKIQKFVIRDRYCEGAYEPLPLESNT